MGTCKSVPQIRRSGNVHGIETIVTAKFRSFVLGLVIFATQNNTFETSDFADQRFLIEKIIAKLTFGFLQSDNEKNYAKIPEISLEIQKPT